MLTLAALTASSVMTPGAKAAPIALDIACCTQATMSPVPTVNTIVLGDDAARDLYLFIGNPGENKITSVYFDAPAGFDFIIDSAYAAPGSLLETGSFTAGDLEGTYPFRFMIGDLYGNGGQGLPGGSGDIFRFIANQPIGQTPLTNRIAFGFDNQMYASNTPQGGQVPEPASFAPVGAALAALAAAYAMRKK
jgi:hypothetical protein